jgi:hypothetical protein
VRLPDVSGYGYDWLPSDQRVVFWLWEEIGVE